MKKILLIVLFAIVSAGTAFGQNYDPGMHKDGTPFRVKYRNIGYSTQTLSIDGDYLRNAAFKYGASLSMGRNYLFHRRPIARMLWIGLDATWPDVNYGHWTKMIGGSERWMHKIDAGLGVGPGVHLTPVGKLGIHTYFRFNPTMSTLVQNFAGEEQGEVEIDMGYASYFTTGGAVSWGFISVGVEARFGKGKYKTIKAPDLSDIIDVPDEDGMDDFDPGDMIDIDGVFKGMFDKRHHKVSGLRVYVSFRF